MFIPYILAFCRFVVGFVFVISGGSKILQFRAFRQTMIRFHVLPTRFTTSAAILFLSSEIAVSILVTLGGPFLLPGFTLAATLLILFSCVLLSVLIRGISTSCHCFGPSERPVSQADIWRNLGFLLCALGGCAGAVWSQEASGSLNIVVWIFAALGAAVFVSIWTQLGELAQLFRPS